MAINKNHEFEELNGVKCAIVEKNASPERISFLEPLLQGNGYTVVVVPSPLAKAAPPTPATAPVAAGEASAPAVPPSPPPPTTFTIGVTDVMFNPTNAIFGRLLKTKEGRIVTLAYWQQQEATPKDDVPYFEKRTTVL